MTQLRTFALVLGLASVLGACPSALAPRGPDPASAVTAYRDALVRDDPRGAFRWIHPDAREGLDERGFEELYRHHRDALVAQAEELVRQVGSGPPTERARVRTSTGDVMLVREPEGWRLLTPVGGLQRP